MATRETVFTRAILVLSLGVSGVLALLTAATRTYWAWIAAAFAIAAWLGWRIAGSSRGRSLAGALMLLAALNFWVLVPELALRLADFRYESGIQFGFPRPSQFLYYEPDEKLFWRLRPDNPDANSLGFPGRELVLPKPLGVFRIAFLGDSVTHQGFPDYVEQLLNRRMSGDSLRYESVTLAVAGYSSHQGRVVAELYGASSQADLAVVYFGWNDHWLAFGEIDAEKVVQVSKSRFGSTWDQVYSSSRLLQGFMWLSARLSGAERERIDQVRVPKDRYRSNLERILEVFRGAGVPVVFVTAASSQYQLGVHPVLVELGQVQDAETGIRLHREYSAITREVGRGAGAFLLDLENEFEALPDADLNAIFLEDRIHLTPLGLSVVADRIASFAEREGLLP